MIDCSFKRITLFVIVLYLFGCKMRCESTPAAGNQCPSSNKESIWRLDGHVVENNPGGNFEFCYIFADSATFYDITGVTGSPIPGSNSTKFTCIAKTYPQCQPSNLSLGFTRRCSRNARDFDFHVNEDGVSRCENLNTTCETKLVLEIETSNVSINVTIDSTSTHLMRSAGMFYGFERLQLHYQICMDDKLKFQVPISAVVPLNVSCHETTELPWIIESDCLQPIFTTRDHEEIVTTVAEHLTSSDITKRQGTRQQNCIDNEKEEFNTATAVTLSLAVVVVIAIGILCYFMGRRQWQVKSLRKSNKEESYAETSFNADCNQVGSYEQLNITNITKKHSGAEHSSDSYEPVDQILNQMPSRNSGTTEYEAAGYVNI